MNLKSLSWILLTLLLTSGCGGDLGDEQQDVVVPETPPHEAATIPVSATNVLHLLANAEAVQHSLRWWFGLTIQAPSSVSPANAVLSVACSDGGVNYQYKDLDNNMRQSANDQVVVSSPACSVTPLGGGVTTFTILSTNESGVTDMRVAARGTVEAWLLEQYGWSHRLTGTFRFTSIDADRFLILSEGPVHLAFPGGRSLEIRNLAVIHRPHGPMIGAITGQFDLVLRTGREAEALVQIDTIGELTSQVGGPSPGLLQISGLNGSKARLRGRLVDGVGALFLPSLDATGTGRYLDLSEVGDVEFYANFR